jgi:hypothetical protein
MNSETYTLTAYDAETGKTVFEWPNIFVATRDRPPTDSTVVGPDDKGWRRRGCSLGKHRRALVR